jgi:hypothetical protein
MSKGKRELNSSINTSKMAAVISDSRIIVETTDNTRAKKPSLQKKGSSSNISDHKQ